MFLLVSAALLVPIWMVTNMASPYKLHSLSIPEIAIYSAAQNNSEVGSFQLPNTQYIATLLRMTCCRRLGILS